MAIRTISSGSAPKKATHAVKASVTVTPKPAVVEILPPAPKVPIKAPTPLSFQAVERILERAIENNDLKDMFSAELIEWNELEDGTTVGVVEDEDTGVRYHWTVCPKTFEPKNLGPIDD